MHYISLRSHQRPLAFPQVIGDMIPADTKIQRLFRYPEVRQEDVFIFLVQRREYQHKGGDVRGRGKVQSAVADTPLQIFLRNRECAGVPFIHRHPADRLLYPLVQTELPESVFLAGVLSCGFTGGFDLIQPHRNAKREVCFLPHLWVRPVFLFRSAVNDGIEGRIDLPSLRDVDSFLMYLVADGVGVVTRRGDQEIQRLHPGIPGALEHNIKELPVGLGV